MEEQLTKQEFYSYEKTIKIPIYNDEIKIISTNDIEEYVKRNNIQLAFNCSDYNAVYIPDYHNTMIFDTSSPVKNDLMCHEAFHITVNMMNRIGQKLVDESEESYAYLLQYITKVLQIYLIKLKQEHNDTDK